MGIALLTVAEVVNIGTGENVRLIKEADSQGAPASTKHLRERASIDYFPGVIKYHAPRYPPDPSIHRLRNVQIKESSELEEDSDAKNPVSSAPVPPAVVIAAVASVSVAGSGTGKPPLPNSKEASRLGSSRDLRSDSRPMALAPWLDVGSSAA